MYIVRWLMGHPIIAVLVLAALALLLNFGQVNEKREYIDTDQSTSAVELSVNSETAKPESNGAMESIVEKLPKIVVSNNIESKKTPDVPSATSTLEITASDPDTESMNISDLGKISTEEMLLMAREAYWNNGLDEAAQIYKQLIKLEPKVIEHKGELGNVYWRQGYPKKAAELYSEISLPMIDQGNSERVSNMIGFIGLFYPDRAAEINKRLQSVTSKGQ